VSVKVVMFWALFAELVVGLTMGNGDVCRIGLDVLNGVEYPLPSGI
jgi:hypothetical protein